MFGMSKDVSASALQFANPGFGIFSGPSLGIHVSLPDVTRLRRERKAQQAEVATKEANPLSDARPVQEDVQLSQGAESLPVAFSAAQGESQAQVTAQAQAPAVTSAELDRASVQAALAGDQSAFADLVGRYQTSVYNMAYRMLGDPTEAEDATQEVFVRAWNQLHTFQLDRRFSTWLLSIASHYSIDMLRRRKPSAPLDDVALFVESDEPAPEELALQGEQREIVQRLLNTLPEKYRSVTVLRYYNDLSYEEIARMTGLTESAVKTQLHRARRMLAEQLLKKGGAPDGMQDLQGR